MRRQFGLSAFVAITLLSSGASAQEAGDMETALAYYAFRHLEAMPILRNRSVRVGDVMILDRQEDVLAGAKDCYPSLETMREQENGADSVRSHHMSVSIETVASIAGGTDVRGLVRADASLEGLYNDSSAVLFSQVVADLPSPDIQALFPDNVARIDKCQYTLDVLASHRYDRLLVTRAYSGSIEVGFVFNGAGSAEIEAATARIGQYVSDASIQGQLEGGLTRASLDRWAQGVIAVQSSRLDRNRLAQAWIFMDEDPETVADLERLVREYLQNDNFEIRQGIGGDIRNFFERLGFFPEDIDEYRRNIFAGEEGEEYSPEDIPDEHWRAAAALAAAIVIVANTG